MGWNQTTGPWTQELIDKMTGMLAAGASFECVARATGMTRGQIAGKKHRLEIQTPKKCPVARHKMPRKRSLKQGKTMTRRLDRDAPSPLLAQPLFLTIEDLKADSCRFPIGSPQEESFRFCGAKTWRLSSYCYCHHDACTEKRGGLKSSYFAEAAE